MKLTPALFALFLLLTGLVRARGAGWNQWLRQAATALAVFAGATLAAALVLPADSRRFWTSTVFETSRVGLAEDTANQSLRGVLARLLHTGDPGSWWTAAAALTAALGLYAAVRAELRGERARAVLCCAATALLVSPVSWSHHWVWCVPGLVLLGAHRIRGAVAAALVFGSYALWWVPHGAGRPELAQNGLQMALSALYPLAGAAFVAAVALGPRGGAPLRPWRTSRTS